MKSKEIELNGIKYIPVNDVKSNNKIIELTGEESVWEIGLCYLIRTVTMIQLGRLIKVTDKELVLENASSAITKNGLPRQHT